VDQADQVEQVDHHHHVKVRIDHHHHVKVRTDNDHHVKVMIVKN
jgi:hypothetical protein